jgi:hypothetical protein
MEISKNDRDSSQATTINELKKSLKLTNRQIYYNVNKLIQQGLVPKGIAYLKEKFNDLQLNDRYVSSFLDRAHRIHIIQPIITRPDIIPEGFIASSKSEKLNWKLPQLTKKDQENLTIQITDKTISYRFSEIYAVNPHSAVLNCLNLCFGYASTLTKQGFRIDLPRTAVIEQHHAVFNKEIAKFTSHYKISYKSDRLTFDSSISSGEFELTNPDHSPDDFQRLLDLFEAVIRGDLTLADLKELCSLKSKIKEALLQKQHNEDKIVNQNVI